MTKVKHPPFLSGSRILVSELSKSDTWGTGQVLACFCWNHRPLMTVGAHMRKLHGFSPRLEARVAGALYLLSIVMGIAAMMLISRKMNAVGDQANLVAAALYTGLTVLLWDLFRPVGLPISTVAAFFSLAGCWFPETWFQAVHVTNFLFFGLYCLLVGYMIVQSRFFPNAVGGLMACAGVCWMTNSWPRLSHALSPYAMIVGLIGEGTFMVYLIVKGLDEQGWREQAMLA